MSCVLRIGGKDLDIDRFVEESGLVPYQKWYKGDPRLPSKSDGPKREDSGCTVDVSEAGFDEFQQQLMDAEVFLEINRDQLMHIKITLAIDHATLDFGVNYRIDKFNQNHYFPPGLLKLIAGLGIGLELSVYRKDE